MYRDSREKREFVKAAALAMTVNFQNLAYAARSSREVVNRAVELWDEIIHQCKDEDDD